MRDKPAPFTTGDVLTAQRLNDLVDWVDESLREIRRLTGIAERASQQARREAIRARAITFREVE